jgi:hypothetical protein
MAVVADSVEAARDVVVDLACQVSASVPVVLLRMHEWSALQDPSELGADLLEGSRVTHFADVRSALAASPGALVAAPALRSRADVYVLDSLGAKHVLSSTARGHSVLHGLPRSFEVHLDSSGLATRVQRSSGGYYGRTSALWRRVDLPSTWDWPLLVVNFWPQLQRFEDLAFLHAHLALVPGAPGHVVASSDLFPWLTDLEVTPAHVAPTAPELLELTSPARTGRPYSEMTQLERAQVLLRAAAAARLTGSVREAALVLLADGFTGTFAELSDVAAELS